MLFLDFFLSLRERGLPASLHEYLTLLESMDRGLAEGSVDDFYFLSRSVFVKHEAWLDRFDQAFDAYFRGIESKAPSLWSAVPEEWLRAELFRQLSDEEREALEREGGQEALWERLKALLEEQKERHQGGNRWVGTGGTSPFGHSGVNPGGFRMGEGPGQGQSSRIWNRREFANLSDNVELNTRNIKMALRQLRLLTREGRPEELDLDATIDRTSRNAGYLDLAMRPVRRNRVRVLLLMDVGGSMYEHVQACEQLFSAARSSFRQLDYFYFHNCIYEKLWKDNRRRRSESVPTEHLLLRYRRDHKVIIIGDAAMAPAELHLRGGSTEHYNAEPGIAWLARIRDHFERIVWLNPNPDYGWSYFDTTVAIRALMGNRMFPLTLDGLGKAMRALRDPGQTYDEVWVRA
jgi:uncharacterized protein with von Willebrand factor type A (vWA) domain